jgi:2-dehydropantoate 2-reductase
MAVFRQPPEGGSLREVLTMRILVVGAGAVGGYFGGRLAEANRDVTFLVRGRRSDEIKEKGLQIVSPNGDLILRPKTITADQIKGSYEMILLGVKSYALEGAMNDFAAGVGPETMILPVLNGMRHLDILATRLGKHAVLGGVCLVATEVDEEGRINQLAGFQSLTYGELDGQSTRRLERLDAALRGASFDTAISDQIVTDMWQKWVQLAATGAITCLLRGDIGEVAAVPGGAGLSLGALRECAAIADASGYPQSEAFLQRQAADLTAKGSHLTTSIYRDLRKGASVEADAILGDLLENGRKRGLVTPILEAAFVNVSIYQHGRDRATRAL